jgi:hypothetical protein
MQGSGVGSWLSDPVVLVELNYAPSTTVGSSLKSS